MDLLTFDFGGTSIKYSVWSGNRLAEGVSSFPTPKTWEDAKTELLIIKRKFEQKYQLAGAAFSFPGCVEQASGQIVGYSAIPYIHNFLIIKDIEDLLGLPAAMENDANCAALAEVWAGAAKDLKDILFVVVGTGVGGSVVVGGKIRYGAHLYGGEWGFMILNPDGKEGKTLSDLGSAVNMANRYCKKIGVSAGTYSGTDIINLMKQGDKTAKEEAETFYKYLSIGLFNLQIGYDPEAIIIGGGIAANKEIIQELENRVNNLLIDSHVKDFTINLKPCKYGNDANLIGAVKNFIDNC